MHCPRCGTKNSHNSQLCVKCGENLSQEAIFHIKTLNYNILMAIIAFGFLTLFLSIFLGYGPLYLIFIFAIISAAAYYFLNLKRPHYHGNTLKCPNCLVEVPSEDFCLECGHHLKGVVAFIQGFRLGSDIEITDDEVIVYRKRKDKNFKYRRFVTEKHFINKIRNLEISQCRLPLSKVPCIKFEYEGHQYQYQVSENTLQELEDIFTSELFQDSNFYREYY